MTVTVPIAGGVTVSNLAIAQADQVTIFGDGTAENPLRAGSGGQGLTLIAEVVPAVTARIGQVVAVTTGTPGVGVCRVTQDPTKVQLGVIVELDGTTAVVQTTGIVNQLTTGQWDLVTGGSGGLVRGAVYYLSLAVNGRITTTRPSTTGQLVSRVGVALNGSTLLITLPTLPVANP